MAHVVDEALSIAGEMAVIWAFACVSRKLFSQAVEFDGEAIALFTVLVHRALLWLETEPNGFTGFDRGHRPRPFSRVHPISQSPKSINKREGHRSPSSSFIPPFCGSPPYLPTREPINQPP